MHDGRASTELLILSGYLLSAAAPGTVHGNEDAVEPPHLRIALPRLGRHVRPCYALQMDPATIRDFVARRWDLVEREKARVLAERYLREGPRMGLLVLSELRQRLQTVGTAPYTPASLRDALAAQVDLAAKFVRVRNGLARH